MHNIHNSHSEDWAGKSTHYRRLRGYSIVELAVSLSIFIVIATLITIAIARSMSVAVDARESRVSEQTLANQLTKIAALDYAELLQDDFQVPDACSGSVKGINGRSCLSTPAGDLEITYRYQKPGSGGAGDVFCARNAKPSELDDLYGFVGVCANVVKINGSNVTNNDAADGEQSTRINAPVFGYRADRGTVRVRLNGEGWQQAIGRTIYAVKANDPSAIVGSGRIATGVVNITISRSNGQSDCNDQSSCVLALAPGNNPNETTGLTLGESTAAGVGERSSTLSGLGKVNKNYAGAGFAVAAGEVTDVDVTIARSGNARIALLAKDGGNLRANPVAGSVCLWATFTEGGTTRSVPACNTTNSEYVNLDYYYPTWDRETSPTIRYPYPTNTPITLSVDHPSRSCKYAPGMVGAVPSTTVAASWQTRAVCTSYTWGVPTEGLGTITLESGKTLERSVVWESKPNNQAMPAAGYVNNGLLWSKPRTAQGCSTDATCTSVVDVELENKICPGAYCYGDLNSEPYISDPANKVVSNNTTAQTTTPITITDPENNRITVRSGATNMSSWGLSYRIGSSGVFIAWPAANTVIANNLAGPVRLEIRSTRPAGNVDLGTIDLALTDNVSPTGTVVETLGFYAGADAWKINTSNITIAQGSTATQTVSVTDVNNNAKSGVGVTLSNLPSGVTVAGTGNTDADGKRDLTLNVGNVAVGNYTITATTSNGRSTTFTLSVAPAAGSMTLSVTGGSQGGAGSATVNVLDRVGAALPGVSAEFIVKRDGNATTDVYPQDTACVTNNSGTCTMPITISKLARAGTYQIEVTSGSATAASTFAVSATPSAISFENVADGGRPVMVRGVANSKNITILDGRNQPIPNITGTISAPSGSNVSLSPATFTTNASGGAAVSFNPTASAAIGPRTLTYTTTNPASSVNFDIQVARAAYVFTTPTLTVAQESTLTQQIVLRDTNNVVQPGVGVTFTSPSSTIDITSSTATTNSSGQIELSIKARPGTIAQEYQAVATIEGVDYQIPFTVTQVAATYAVSGIIEQGGSNQNLQVFVADAAGQPLKNTPVTASFSTITLGLSSTTGTTDERGITLFSVSDTGPTAAGGYPLRLTAAGLTRDVRVEVRATPASINIEPKTINQGGSEFTYAQQVLKDKPWAYLPLDETDNAGSVLYQYKGDTLNGVNIINNSGSGSVVDSLGAEDGKALRFRDTTSPYGLSQLDFKNNPVTYDPTKTYKISARVRTSDNSSTNVGGSFHIGVAGLNDSGAYVNVSGANSNLSQYYAAANNTVLRAEDGWTTFSGYISGSSNPGSGSAAPYISAPAKLHTSVTKITPAVVMNVRTTNNQGFEIDNVILEEVNTPTKTFKDVSGNNRHGVLPNGASAPTNVDGVGDTGGSAFSFSNTSRIEIPTSGITPANNQSVTVEYWTSAPSGVPTNKMAWSAGGTNLYQWSHSGGFGNSTTTATTGLSGGPASALGQNNVHVVTVVTRGRTVDTYKMYINGLLYNQTRYPSGTAVGSALGDMTSIIIGNDTSGTRAWDAPIDNFAIYQGELSTARIAEHYAVGAGFAATSTASEQTAKVTVKDLRGTPIANLGLFPGGIPADVDYTMEPTDANGETTLTLRSSDALNTGFVSNMTISPEYGTTYGNGRYIRLPYRSAAAAETNPHLFLTMDNGQFSDTEDRTPSWTPVGFNGILEGEENMNIDSTDGYTPGSRSLNLKVTERALATYDEPNSRYLGLSAWVKPTSSSGLTFRKGQASGSAVGWQITKASNTSLKVVLGNGSLTREAILNLPAGSQLPDWDNKWTHVYVGADLDANTAIVYINGTQAATAVFNGTGVFPGSIRTTAQLVVGDRKMSGNVDDFALYYSPLSAGTIKGLAKR